MREGETYREREGIVPLNNMTAGRLPPQINCFEWEPYLTAFGEDILSWLPACAHKQQGKREDLAQTKNLDFIAAFQALRSCNHLHIEMLVLCI